MENYFKEPIEQKLFYAQYDEFTEIVLKKDKEYVGLESELFQANNELNKFVKEKLSEEEKITYNNLAVRCEVAYGAYEQYLNLCLYKLGMNDAIQIKTRFTKNGTI